MKKRRKICIFDSYFPLSQGGAEYQAYLISKHLDPKQFDIFFLSFNQAKEKLIKMDGFRIYTINPYKWLSRFGKPYFFYYFSIKKIFLQERPDIVYRRMGSAIPGVLGLLKRTLDFKLIWACAHINNLNKFKIQGLKNIFNNFDELFRIYGIKTADKILVQTNYQKQLLLNNFKRDSLLFPNLHPLPKNKIDKNDYPIKILWIANHKKWKQPEIFLTLADKLRDFLEVQFIMIGRAGPRKYWKNINKKINNLQQFDYKGELPVEDVNRLLSESHILVNTSLYEGFPNTFIQAWMRKVPVISLNVDPDNFIKEQKIGFHSKTIEQLVEDTKTLIKDNKLREEMGERAQQFAFGKFSIENIKTLLNLIENGI